MARKPKAPKQVEALTHDEAARRNIPTAELQSVAQRMEEMEPFAPVAYPRQHPLAEGETRDRDEDLDPQIVWKGATITLTDTQREQLVATGKVEIGDAQLVWRGKDTQDWSDLVVQAPPIYIQEKIHPKVIIDDLKRQTKERAEADNEAPDLFGDFNGIDPEAKTEFYQHDQNWTNRMILGDSLQVMASLAEREGLRGQVQCIFFDPPYGIKFNSNWQVSTRSRDVKDGQLDQITREPEQVRAFRDTWKDGIHSYLTYLRDRLTVMRDMLTESGSIFVQISDENVHRVRTLLDEIFGENNFVSEIIFKKKSSTKPTDAVNDFILWYCLRREKLKLRQLFVSRRDPGVGSKMTALVWRDGRALQKSQYADAEIDGLLGNGAEWARVDYPVVSQHPSKTRSADFFFQDQNRVCGSNKQWRFGLEDGMPRLSKSQRLFSGTGKAIGGISYWNDWNYENFSNIWEDIHSENHPIYIVQTSQKPIERCMLMTTDPGDLVLDPTCGSGTTATVAEQWGRRWITLDTSRIALALARTRLMSARYPYYFLKDSSDGRKKEQEIKHGFHTSSHSYGDLRQGFVYGRAQRITLKSIADNAEIDVIWDEWANTLEPLRNRLNSRIATRDWQEWEIPYDPEDGWPEETKQIHAKWWEARIARQKEIDASIAKKADVELLYDRPYEDKSKVRVAGPFTVESLSPHRMIPADEDDAYLRSVLEGEDPASAPSQKREATPEQDFAQMVIENLKTAGVHQATKEDRITFEAITGWPGTYIAAEGRYLEGETERRAALFIGPEFGTVTRADLTAAAREALDARFDALIACGFSFDAHTSELGKLGPLPILKARMNPDLHMSDELKNTGAGNLFVVFGEPDIEWKFDDDGKIVVEVLGVDVFDPKTGEVRASGKDDIAAWFVDTDYNEESFFVRHAYFMGANDPYKSLKTALRAEIDEEAWRTLYRDTSRPFARPTSGRFAVKVINHFGDEVMKVFGV